MAYRNIVFIKLEKRLFNDYRWYMMSEVSQLNFIRFILFAAESYNKIPKNLDAIKKAFKTNQDLKSIADSIAEIKNNFPKFKENKHFYYFDDFGEKTNYISKRELPSNCLGNAQQATDKEEEEDKEKDKEEEKEKKEKSPKTLYLNFVYLTTKEHEDLLNWAGKSIVTTYIERLNDYLGSKGKKYKSHYHTLRTWIRKDNAHAPYQRKQLEQKRDTEYLENRAIDIKNILHDTTSKIGEGK